MHYHYVGPAQILKDVAHQPEGVVIQTREDVQRWFSNTLHIDVRNDTFTVTFVIDTMGQLRIAERHSEHVACAGGNPVRAAGEMTFHVRSFYLSAVSNLSTGFCPEPACWEAIEQALDHAQIEHPGALTESFDFRLCEQCHQRQVIKDQWFECVVCGATLPARWNF